MNVPPALANKFSALGIEQFVPCGGGCISHGGIVTTKKGEFFLKWNERAPRGFFLREAGGLAELAKAGVVKVPDVIEASESDGDCPACIVLEILQAGEQSKVSEVKLGEQLAALHRVSAEQFGFFEDNFIGLLPQENKPHSRWGEFFVEQRLGVQARLGREKGWFDRSMDDLFRAKVSKIIAVLNEYPERPSLLHGDLWSGNVFWTRSGAALIDPAVYYGNREADLAFTEMFGGFGRAFYESYNANFPLQHGYSTRRPILNLYHLMTHSNLFAGAYITSTRHLLASL